MSGSSQYREEDLAQLPRVSRLATNGATLLLLKCDLDTPMGRNRGQPHAQVLTPDGSNLRSTEDMSTR